MTGITAHEQRVVSALRGTRLERTLLRDGDGREDVTSAVTWLQGHALYCDLRRPEGFVPPTARCLDEMTLDDLHLLARQEAFAGRLAEHPDHVEWIRDVDLHPAVAPDAGTLEHLDVDTVLERGFHADYIEEWRVDSTGPVTEFLLADADADADTESPRAVLLRAGRNFGYARPRSTALPARASLSALLDASVTVAEARSLLDCEVSLGIVGDDRWTITRSTLPFREGTDLAVVVDGTEVTTSDIEPSGRPATRRWRVARPRRSIA
ncbi:hypothetical protein [Rhodococcus triatomae]|uniref:hypothetical protein n=1 Tax=Rhodococcus triatomae TaxID=300028 RepID=UPI001FE36DA6|nr:hypothetical protein [Rhodococcus triatomae]